ncbi:MAG TPA: fibronectin type III domain-containing protein [Jatrophihabitans sp.]|nr:fibronectin type III domain-containing protein [Jatrophihabitans sp.]
MLNTAAGLMCVHGDDSEFRVAAGGDGSDARVPRLAIPCHGDGTSGNRIALYYGYFAGTPNRIASVRGQIISAIEQANDIVFKSAQQTGSKRWLRVLTDSSCTPRVQVVQLPGSARGDFGNTINAAEAAGLNAHDRKYVIFVDTRHFCGLGSLYDDDQPGVMNINNGGPSWARLDSECWSGAATAHEIMHMLGSVQPSAPHYDGTGHCTDDHDLMCYQNRGGKRVRIRCAQTSEENRLDCGHDDYFNTDPASGSYLARHWDTARSSFLYGGGPAQPAPPGAVTGVKATMSTLTSSVLRWAAPRHSRVTSYVVSADGQAVWRGTGTSWTDNSAQAGAGNYEVQATNEAGAGPWSSPTQAALPPPASPTSVTAIAGRPISIDWDADSRLASGYTVYGLPGGSAPHYLSTWPATARAASDTTWPFLRHWSRYRVCAYNATTSSCTDQPAT